MDKTTETDNGGTRETVGFDRMQDMIINIAEYGTSLNKSVHIHKIEKISVTVSLNEFGELSRSNTSSTGTGSIIGSHINYIGDKLGKTFRVTGYRELRTVMTEAGETVTMIMSKSDVLGCPWSGIKGNKLYTEMANGFVRHTGWQETRTVKLENGVLARMTVSRVLTR